MEKILFLSFISCLIGANRTKIFRRCELAQEMHKAELDGYEGTSLELMSNYIFPSILCVKKIVLSSGGIANWMKWRIRCQDQDLSYWLTGCHLWLEMCPSLLDNRIKTLFPIIVAEVETWE
ncbi:lysozyme-like protein 6 [Trichosurus vulpecula]|uniref:lysozyme-like protein 6 n=1 Tax=Trichosurus vulpecula TaxID=9337 RepID=UPI00186AE882|nr:lysozyme-like protein 6 [Trichosurus vulpecula]